MNNNEVVIEDLKNGVHIPSYKAKNIVFHEQNQTEIFKTYKAVIPYSLDLIELYNTLGSKAFFKKGKQIYCDSICNVGFDDSYYETIEKERVTYNRKKKKVIKYRTTRGKIIKSGAELRTELYLNGFRIYDNNKTQKQFFMQYKRSSAKSKCGDSWYIIEDQHDHMLNWSRLDIEFPTDVSIDYASLKAYESLPASSLIGLIHINPEHILIIDDVPAAVKFTASVTSLDNTGIPITQTIEDYSCSHDVWDGQGLISEDIVPEEYKDHCMVLLRERFLKCAAFQTKLQAYFKQRCKDEGRDYETATTINMFRKPILLKEVELVITPDSLKLLKFSKFVNDNQYVSNAELTPEQNDKCRTYNYWVNHISGDFGLCKQEHESKFGTHQQLTYQFINSFDLSRNQVEELLQPEKEYISLLKNDVAVLKHHLNNNYVSYNKNFINSLLACNDQAANTPMFKNQRHTIVDHYIKSLKQGAIKIDNCDYMTLFSSPFEMLCAAYGDTINVPLIKRADMEKGAVEVYSKRFKDGEYCCGWRNPQINQGNLVYCYNKAHPEYQWFNISYNIIIIDGWSNFVETAQGADEDSDTFAQLNNPLLTAVVKDMVQSGHYPVPINSIKFKTNKKPRKLVASDSADIDNIISTSSSDIGKVCNWAAVLNSKYWDQKAKGASQAVLDEIYKKSSMCSSLSQICIDKSKIFFDNEDCNVQKCLETVYDLRDDTGNQLIEKISLPVRKNTLTEYDAEFVKEQLKLLKHKKITEQEFNDVLDEALIEIKVKKKTGERKEVWIYKPIRPMYFAYLDTGDKRQAQDISKSNWDCPMNYVIEILNSLSYKDREANTPLSAVIKKVDLKNVNYRHIQKVFELCYEFDKKCNALWLEGKEEYKTNKATEEEYRDQLINDVCEIHIKPDTIMQILYLCYDPAYVKLKKTFKVENDEGQKVEIRYTHYSADVCGILWDSHPTEFKKAFIYHQKAKATTLKPVTNGDENYDLKIWGREYKKITA